MGLQEGPKATAEPEHINRTPSARPLSGFATIRANERERIKLELSECCDDREPGGFDGRKHAPDEAHDQ